MHARDPPGPRGPRIYLAVRRDPMGFFTRLAQEHGEVAHFRVGRQRYYHLSHPDDIRDVLVTHHRNFTKGQGLQAAKGLLGEGLLTSEAEFHKRQRRLMQPLFHHQRVAGYAQAMVEHAARARARWREGQELDMSQEMSRLTLAIVGQTLFSADIEGEAGEVGQALKEGMLAINRSMGISAGPLRRFLGPDKAMRVARQRLDKLIFRLIAERRTQGAQGTDLLSLLLEAQDEEGGSMSDAQVRDEAVTLLLAGHETTAQALTWTWYLLAQHPAVEQRLHAELDEVLGDRLPAMEDVPRLAYTRMVLAESMRLYPPAWVLGRRAIQDYEVRGYRVPARSILIMSQWVMHRHPKYWEEPERFDPLRFAPDAPERPKFAYFPFGGGPRVCIGEPFAWMEGVLLLATLAQRWRPRLVPGHAVQLQPLITLRPRFGMRMTLEPRAAKP